MTLGRVIELKNRDDFSKINRKKEKISSKKGKKKVRKEKGKIRKDTNGT